MPLSHNLPQLLLANPFYDQILARLAQFLATSHRAVQIIDVGANIGDTAQIVSESAECDILCIEGNSHFFDLLVLNTKQLLNVRCVKALLSDKSGVTSSLRSLIGTAFVSNSESETATVTTLDELLVGVEAVNRIDVLKIDTDGYDFRVLRGALGLLRQQPIILLELAPEHYQKVAGDSPEDLFPFLEERGYEQVVFYDSAGYLMIAKSASDLADIRQLIQYALRRGLYYDVLAFPKSKLDECRRFLQSERRVFPDFNRPYLTAVSPPKLL